MSEYTKICEQAVRAGGAEVVDWIERFDVQKKGPADLVTQADLASQEAIRRTVLGAFPHHSLLAEEDEAAERSAGRTEYRWIADPLDGTTNYVHRVPHFCVSLALERGGELLTGAVFDPIRDQCYTATAGEGAFLDGRPIHPSNVVDLADALAAAGFPPRCPRDSLDLLVFLEAMTACQAIRRTGSSALNLCYLAAGRFDVYWSFSTKIWDMAAGALIVREAGGIVTGTDGGSLVLDTGHFLAAANEPLHAQLLELVVRARKKRSDGSI